MGLPRTKVSKNKEELDKWESEEILECPICEKFFLKSKNNIEKTENSFCSSTCYGKFQQTEFKKSYGSNWTEIREKVLERDNHLCRRCFNQADEVHHIIKKQYFDTIEEANSMKNLVSLCYNCHSILEGLPEKEQKVTN